MAVTRPPLQVEAVDLGELDLDVPVAVKHPAQRRCDLALGEDPGRHLVEQRLEEVVVDAVHQGDLGPAPRLSVARSEQAAETSPHDHDSMGIRSHRRAQRERPAYAPRRSSRWSPTRIAFAIAVSAGLTAPMLGKKLVSTT